MHLFKLRLSTLITAVVALALLAVAIDWSGQPGVAEAAAPNTPQWPSSDAVVSGDGTMKLNWNNASNATGYEYRYSSKAACLLYDVDCVADETAWALATTGNGNTEYTIPKGKLTVGTTYWFQIRAVNTDDDPDTYSEPSETRNALQRAAPAKLADVVATAGNARVTLSWDAPDDDTITSYDYRIDPDPAAGASGWSDWQRFTTSTNIHTVTGLTNGTTYSFQVRANNNQGAGPASETVSATPTGPPAAPEDLRATPQNGSVRLHWNNPNDSNIDKYQIRQQEKPAGGQYGDFSTWADIDGSDADTTQHTVSDLTNGTEYTFEVRAIDSDRVEDDRAGAASSATATPTTAARAPSQMSNVQHTVTSVSGGSGGTVTFTWDDPGESFATKYEYRYKCHNTQESCDDTFTTESWNNAADRTSSVVADDSFSMDVPGNASVVYFQLRAVNTNADPDIEGPKTDVSVERSNTPSTSTPPPAAPSGFSATADDNGDIQLAWTKDAVASQGYQLRQSENGGSTWTDWASIANSKDGEDNDDSYTPENLVDGTSYTFELRAVAGTADEPIYGGASQDGPVTQGRPNPPTGLAAEAINDDDTTDEVDEREPNALNLSWTAPDAITGLTITRFEYRTQAPHAVGWSVWKRIVNCDGDCGGTTSAAKITGLAASTPYDVQVRAVAVINRRDVGGEESNTASGTTADPPADDPLTAPEAPTGLSAAAGNEQVTLTWTNPNNPNILQYRYRFAVAGSAIDAANWQQINGSDKDTTSHTLTDLTNGTTYSFQVQAVGAGSMIGAASDTATATPRVPPRRTGPSGPQRDSVTARNSDETINVTINKPASVMLDVAVRDQSCAAAAPAGTVHLCVEASASGALENLAASPAFMTIVISPELWGHMEEAYNADPRRFFLSKRSSPGEAWANITWCLDDPAVECYLLQETEQGGATMFVYNIVSFSQYAIRTVSVDAVGGGGGCVGINCRAVIIGGGGGTGRGPQHRLPATTRTPAPTARPTATPTVRPTVVPPTPQPTVRPTLVPPTPQPTVAPPTPRPTERPTVVPPTVRATQPPQPTATAPAPVATPPPPTVAPTPPPPAPTEAPTPEPTGETAALPPPTEPVPEITAVPPAVEPGSNLTMWLIIVIVIAVAAVGGMGFVAFRLLRAQ